MTGNTTASPAYLEAESAVLARHGLTARSRLLRVGDSRRRARLLETGEGEPALLLHGITLCPAHWAPLINRLAPLHCFAIDMPGHGGSDGAVYRGVDLRGWHREFITACLDELGIESAHILGHSYGGMLGLWMALDAPERVRSVIALGTPAIAFGARPDPTLRMLALPAVGRLSLSLPSPTFVYRRTLAISLGREAIESAPPELIRATYLGTRRPGFSKTVSSYLREQFRGARAKPRRYVLGDVELERIRRPVLVIWGEHDDRYQPVEEGERRSSLIRGARFERVPGGHEPWLDDAARCAHPIDDFLAAVDRRA